MAINLKLKMYR